jgi:hypothetical protein
VSDQYWSPLFAKKGSFHINISYLYLYLSKELMFIKICFNRIFLQFIQSLKFHILKDYFLNYHNIYAINISNCRQNSSNISLSHFQS